MTQTTATIQMTPVQFQIARNLSRAFGHLWAAVPDGTYTVEGIQAWVDEHISYPGMIAGIDSPSLVSEGGELADLFDVVHQTGTGRLTWKVTPWGNTQLIVTRPGDIEVANITLLVNEQERFDPQDVAFSFCIGNHERASQLEAIEDASIHEEQLFHRHVDALVRPIVAVLTATEEDARANEKEPREDYDAYRARVIVPAIAQAHEWLAPLYGLAMPDPYFDGAISFEEIEEACHGKRRFGSIREEQPGYAIPETFYARHQDGAIYNVTSTGRILSVAQEQRDTWAVFHRQEWFPASNEKTAVYATLLLQKHPHMSLMQAMKQAMLAESYRPESV